MATQNDQQPDECWQQFVASGLVEKGLRVEDFTSPEERNVEYSKDSPKLALKALRSVLTPDAHRRLSGRWRKYKYNAKNNTTTLTIRKETLSKLKAMAQRTGLAEDNYELLFEYLLDPNEDLEPSKQEVSTLDIESGLDFEARSEKLRAKLRFRPHSWKHILDVYEYAFKMGWAACKALHAKKRTVEARDEAAKAFADKLNGF
ncbi:hypothetical protein [Alteromonas gilva]|uniref:Uncharacterized protein n=1 Tax=Alteromonas gilva TaxID=2987522 RepID=A0ABT5L7M4_9ALTE|nr:hypothetical protein [Alteromonas gilva]MDC8832888.1 hypothetical protein [Alteromonas gilva]